MFEEGRGVGTVGEALHHLVEETVAAYGYYGVVGGEEGGGGHQFGGVTGVGGGGYDGSYVGLEEHGLDNFLGDF